MHYAVNKITSVCQKLITYSRNLKLLTVPSKRYSSITSTDMAELEEMKSYWNIKTHEDIYQFSLKNPEAFWAILARSRIQWIRPFHSVLSSNLKEGTAEWFHGGLLNVSVNCIDRHMKKDPKRTALIWERDEPDEDKKISYEELSSMTNKIGNLLRSHDVGPGDCVAIYMTVSPLAVASMMGIARIGAIHMTVFAGFSAKALAARLNDAKATILITSDQAKRGGKTIELKNIVDDALTQCPSIRHVFVSKRTDANIKMWTNHQYLEDEMEKQSTKCEPSKMHSEDPLFILYTSGSTGPPKGIVHSQAGYLLYATVTQQHVFDYKAGDIFGCVADVGWITGHTYTVYGPLSLGGTTLLFEGTPLYPDAGRYWRTVERHRLTHFYCAPTAIRLLLSLGNEWVTKYDRSSLRVLGSVGEPLNKAAWEWYHKVVGNEKCDLVDTWWQTETGGICIAPRPSAPGAPIIPTLAMRPMFGILPVLVDPQGKVITGNNVSGTLCLGQPWPGMAKTLFQDHSRFLETYFQQFPELYFTGDGANRDSEGYYQITGRTDDVINISGHRVGTAEIEDILNHHPDIAESAIVGYPHSITGEGIYAFLVLKKTSPKSGEPFLKEVRNYVRKELAAYAVPGIIQICPGLPKTRSGKIMRRILRSIAADKKEFGDTSTLADPSIINEIIKNKPKIKNK